MCNEVNGWPNYETWNIALWLTNDQSDYEMTQEWIADLDDPYDSDAAYELSKVIKEYVEDNNPLLDDASMYSDMLSAAISTCDFYRIAERWIEDYIAENPQELEEDSEDSEGSDYCITPDTVKLTDTGDPMYCVSFGLQGSYHTFWEAFNFCIQDALGAKLDYVVVEWYVMQHHIEKIRAMRQYRNDRLIAKQASRSTRKDA